MYKQHIVWTLVSYSRVPSLLDHRFPMSPQEKVMRVSVPILHSQVLFSPLKTLSGIARPVAVLQGRFESHRLRHPLEEASLPSHRHPEPWPPVTISSFLSLSNRINSASTKVLWRATKWHDWHIQVQLYCKAQENHLCPYSGKALKSFWGMQWWLRQRKIHLARLWVQVGAPFATCSRQVEKRASKVNLRPDG